MLSPLGHDAWISGQVARLPTRLQDRARVWRDRREHQILSELAREGHPLHPLPGSGWTGGRASVAHARANIELREIVAVAAGKPVVHVRNGLAATDSDIRSTAETFVRRVYCLTRVALPAAATAAKLKTQDQDQDQKNRLRIQMTRDWSAYTGCRIDQGDRVSHPSVTSAQLHALAVAEEFSGITISGRDDTARWQRATDPAWWRGRLRGEIRQRREAVWARIDPTNVKWISPDGLSEYRSAQRAQAQWLANHEMVDQFGERIGLDTLAEGRGGRRYSELLARTAGLAKVAADAGMEPRLLTITTPSRMHPTTSAGGHRRQNSNYDETIVREAHRWAMDAWARWRAALGRRGIDTLWAIGAQPHHDGTPHYHAVVWAQAADWPEVERLAVYYWWSSEPDAHSTADRRIRCDSICNGHTGAVAYLARVVAYVARQVDVGPHADEAEAASAWASAHGIRRYRTSETHATVWRYLRRRDMDVSVLGSDAVKAQKAARNGDYAKFLVHRAAADLRPAYRDATNRYSEPARALVGIQGRGIVVIPTRTWRLARKAPSSDPRTVMQEEPRATFDASDYQESELEHLLKTDPKTGPPEPQGMNTRPSVTSAECRCQPPSDTYALLIYPRE